MYACYDAAGAVVDPDNVLPTGAPLTEAWCRDAEVPVNASAYHSRLGMMVPPYLLPRVWRRARMHYDNVGAAALTLFSISTTELWVDAMHAASDAAGPGLQPVRGARPAAAVFFVVFMVIGTFFVLQLFVSVTLEKVRLVTSQRRECWRMRLCPGRVPACMFCRSDRVRQLRVDGALLRTSPPSAPPPCATPTPCSTPQFSELHQQQGRSALLTPQQEQWLTIQRLLGGAALTAKPPPPEARARRAVYDLVTSNAFDVAVLGLILLNAVMLALVHWNMSAGWQVRLPGGAGDVGAAGLARGSDAGAALYGTGVHQLGSHA